MHPRAFRWYGVITLFVIVAISYIDRINIAVLITDASFLNHTGIAPADRVSQGLLATEKAFPLSWHFDEEKGGPPDLAALLAGKGADSHYYCCGPTPMLDNFEKTCEQLGLANAHIERFAAVHVEAPSATQSYVVECARSGKTVEVPPGKSILDSLIDAGLNPDHSCKEGVCGACETKVLDGEVDHHDGILTKLERASNKTMMICVSGCKRGPLVLDI